MALVVETVPNQPEVSDRYFIMEALAYIEGELGVKISLRGFRFWISRRWIRQGEHYYKSPGPNGHLFFSKKQLDEIVKMIRTGEIEKTPPPPDRANRLRGSKRTD